MNWVHVLVNFLGAGLDSLILYAYYQSILGQPKTTRKLTLSIYGCAWMLFFGLILVIPRSTVLPILYFGAVFALSFLYKRSIIMRFAFSSIIMILLLLFEVLVGTVMAIITDHDIRFLTTDLYFWVQGMGMSKLFVLLLVAVFDRVKNAQKFKRFKTYYIPLLILPVPIILFIYTLSKYLYVISGSQPFLLIATVIIVLIIFNILIFYIFYWQLQVQEKARIDLLAQQQLQHQASYFRELAEQHRLSNRTMHDLKNQLYAISTYLSRGDVELARGKIDQMCSIVVESRSMCQTGNDALDALVNAKYQIMTQNGMRYQQKIMVDFTGAIGDIDLCIIIGNALDNAIEACLKIERIDQREIDLNVKQIGEYLYIEVSNTLSEDSLAALSHAQNKQVHGRLPTTKADKALHGFGLQSMDETACKYAGNLNIRLKENRFVLSVYLLNPVTNNEEKKQP